MIIKHRFSYNLIEYEFVYFGDKSHEGEPVNFTNKFFTKQFLRVCSNEYFSLQRFRNILSEWKCYGKNLNRLDDDGVLNCIADLIISRRLKVYRLPKRPSFSSKSSEYTVKYQEINKAGTIEQIPVRERGKTENIETKRDWIEIQLIDELDSPITNEKIQLFLSDGTTRMGSTAKLGVVKFNDIPSGNCKLSFSNLDGNSWYNESNHIPDSKLKDEKKLQDYTARKKPSSNGERYVVNDGEWVGKIALAYGFTNWEEDVWNHPNNAELRKRRDNDSFTLGVGDELYIPPWKEKFEMIETNKRHQFRLNLPGEMLRISLLDDKSEPLSNEEYLLKLDGIPESAFVQKNNATDDSGMIVELLPPNATKGTLLLPRLKRKIFFNLGFLTPLDKEDENKLIRGVQQRLSALGFRAGPIDGIYGPITKASVRSFQRFCKEHSMSGDSNVIDAGEIDGVIGPKTIEALKRFYGC